MYIRCDTEPCIGVYKTCIHTHIYRGDILDKPVMHELLTAAAQELAKQESWNDNSVSYSI
jgi:hypothetical protein